MTDTQLAAVHPYLRIDGADSTDEFQRDLLQLRVELDFDQPAMAEIILNDSRLYWIDQPSIWPGKPLEVLIDSGSGRDKIFEGEIVGIEPRFDNGVQHLTIRAFNLLHRLTRGKQTKTWLNVNDSDILKEIAGKYGLSLETDLPSTVSDHVFQHNQTDFAFLHQHAARFGRVYWVDGKKLQVKRPESNGTEIPLEWGKTLRQFAPRLSTHQIVDAVTVRGWDPKQRQEIIGKATASTATPNGSAGDGLDVTKKAHGIDATFFEVDQPITTQDQADEMAKAKLDALSRSFIVAEGEATGNPKLVPGVVIEVSAVGDRFNGKYLLSGVTHRYSSVAGYGCSIRARNNPSSGLLQLMTNALTNPGNHAPPAHLAIGLVTDNQDPDDLGRVKIKFPALADDHATFWSRVAVPGGGRERGMQFIPEVDDEVLVAFPFGDISVPIVVGGLWNGIDVPPLKTGTAIAGGKVEKRVIKSRSGHTVTLDDAPSGGGITIEDPKGNKIFLDTQTNSLKIEVQKDIEIKAQGNIKITAQGQLEISAMAGAKVESSATLDLKGAIVNLN